MSLVKTTEKNFSPDSFSTLLDRFFNDTVNNNFRLNQFVPKIDISEEESKFEVQVAAPGMKKEDFNIEVENRMLTISGERKFENEEKTKTYHKIETQYGSFSRSFTLPESVKDDAIEASYKDGILTVHVPKDKTKLASKKVSVK